MKNLTIIITVFVLFNACTASKEARTSRIENRQNMKILTAEIVKNAVESRKYIIKLDRIYPIGGGMVLLQPRSNYIIIDGNIVSVKAAYLGRQYDFKPIAGIHLAAKSEDYSIIKNFEKQEYEINMKVTRGGDTFNVLLNIKNSGKCYASISSLKIDAVNYSGEIVPIPHNSSGDELNENLLSSIGH